MYERTLIDSLLEAVKIAEKSSRAGCGVNPGSNEERNTEEGETRKDLEAE